MPLVKSERHTAGTAARQKHTDSKHTYIYIHIYENAGTDTYEITDKDTHKYRQMQTQIRSGAAYVKCMSQQVVEVATPQTQQLEREKSANICHCCWFRLRYLADYIKVENV